MREIRYIVFHCTAGPQTQTVEIILDYWKRVLGWKSPGYHHLIRTDGTVADLLPIEKPSNGVAGHNAKSIHISYIGGVDRHGRAFDNRTGAQKLKMLELAKKYKAMFPKAEFKGHRDFAGVTKACPSFEVSEFIKCTGLS